MLGKSINLKNSSYKNKSGIYKIQNIVNNKLYIGSSKNIFHRREQHYSQLKKGNHSNTYLQKTFDKYGEKNIIFEMVEEVKDLSKLLEREQYWIDYYMSSNRDKGYNISPDVLRPTFSEETRRKLSEANKGKKHKEETKKKLSKIFKGRKNKNISKALKEYYKTHKGTMFGKKFSEETRRKLSEAKRGKPSPKKGIPLNKEQLNKLRNKSLNCKKIVCLNNLNCYVSQTQASDMIGISNKHIGDVCKKRRDNTYGYKFMYLEDFIKEHPELIKEIKYNFVI